jgi:hypothetical protein
MEALDKKPLTDLNLKILMDKAYSISIIASTRAGKSTLVERIINDYFQNKINTLITESPNAELYASKIFKEHCILANHWDENIIKDAYKINKMTKNKYMFNFILDDITSARNSPVLKNVFTIFRNNNISAIVVGQSLTMIPPIGRSNINFIFLGALYNDVEIEKVIKEFLLSYFDSGIKMVDKIKFYKQMTRDKTFFVIDNLENKVSLLRLNLK